MKVENLDDVMAILRKIKPVRHDGVFILEDDRADNKTSCGIFFPNPKVGYKCGVVVSVGQNVKLINSGNRVLLNRAYGNKVFPVCPRLIFVSVDQIECIIDDDSRIG